MTNEAIKIDDDIIIEERLNTEAGALQHIVLWSEDRPMWQRDALRRLCLKDVLNEADYVALMAIAKSDETAAQPLKHMNMCHYRMPLTQAEGILYRTKKSMGERL